MRGLVPLAGAALLVAISACSSGTRGEGTTSAAPTSSETTWSASSPEPSTSAAVETSSGSLGDRSSLVEGYVPPSPVATTRGTVRSTTREESGASVEVLSLQAGPTSTVMHFRIVPDKKLDSLDREPWTESWRCLDGVKLVDVPRKKVYGIGMASVASGQTDTPGCLTTGFPVAASKESPVYLFAYYGPVDAAVTTLTLRIKGFKDVEVPVTRS